MNRQARCSHGAAYIPAGSEGISDKKQVNKAMRANDRQTNPTPIFIWLAAIGLRVLPGYYLLDEAFPEAVAGVRSPPGVSPGTAFRSLSGMFASLCTHKTEAP